MAQRDQPKYKSPSKVKTLERGVSRLYPHTHGTAAKHGLFLTSKLYRIQVNNKTFKIDKLTPIKQKVGPTTYVLASYSVKSNTDIKNMRATMFIVQNNTFYSKYKTSYSAKTKTNELVSNQTQLMDSEFVVDGLKVCLLFR